MAQIIQHEKEEIIQMINMHEYIEEKIRQIDEYEN